MEINQVQIMGKELNRVLRLRTPPLGISLIQHTKDIPKEYDILDVAIPFCSVVGMARYYELPVAITRETGKNVCLGADMSFGWGGLPEDFSDMVVGLFTDTHDRAEKLLSEMCSLENSYQAIAVAPLESVPNIPDVVQIWCNSLQLSLVVYANTWYKPWDRIELSSNGHGGCCYEGLTVPFLNNRLNIGIVDMGDRKHGHASDDEMLIGFPIAALETIFNGILENQNTRHRIPVLYDFESVPFPVPQSVISRKGRNFR
jgi:uncharacterized protein (DUF169 family)